MAYIVFDKHPGDLLSYESVKRRIISLQLGAFKIILDMPLKYTSYGYVAYFTPQKKVIEKLSQHLRNMQYEKEIVKFEI